MQKHTQIEVSNAVLMNINDVKVGMWFKLGNETLMRIYSKNLNLHGDVIVAASLTDGSLTTLFGKFMVEIPKYIEITKGEIIED